MRSMAVVCDNHRDRLAVASCAIHWFERPGFRPTNFTLASQYVDLCSECARTLGWRPEPQPEVRAYDPAEPISDAQRRLLFARCRDIGIGEDERHALLEAHAGDPSVRNLLGKDFDRVMVALDMEADRRRG